MKPRFIPNNEGLVFTAEQRERVRQASLKREATIRQKVSVGGVVYANLTRAANATGISARSIARYAKHGVSPQTSRHFTPRMLEICKTIHFV